MTQSTGSRSELSATTTISENRGVKVDATAGTSSGKAGVLLFAVTRFERPSESKSLSGSIPVDDFVADLEKDEEWASALAEARKEISTSVAESSPIAALRLERGFSQRQLAALLGTTQNQVAKLEGSRANPELKTILKLAKVLEVAPTDILRGLMKRAQP